MTNDELKDFINYLHQEYQLWFIYDGKRYCVFVWEKNGEFSLSIDKTDPEPLDFMWGKSGGVYKKQKIVDAFLTEKMFDGKSFLEIAKDVAWINGWE